MSVGLGVEATDHSQNAFLVANEASTFPRAALDGDCVDYSSAALRPLASRQVVARSLVSSSAPSLADASVNSTADQVLVQIESVFEDLADAFLAERNEFSITLSAHCPLRSHGAIDHRQQGRRTRSTVVTFPGKSAKEAWRFSQSSLQDLGLKTISLQTDADQSTTAVIVRLLELMHDAIRSGTVITKR